MTGSLRSTAKNPVAIALMGLLILVFLILGVGGGGRFPDIFGGARPDAVVSAGAHSVNVATYRRIFDQQKQQFEQQAKQQFTTQFLVSNGFDQQLLSQIGMDQAEAEMLGRAGIDPAPALVDAQIRQIPQAFDKVTGKFSEQQFIQLLASQGLTPREVQNDFNDELAQRHFTTAATAAYQAPRAFAALNAIAGLQSRDVSYFLLDPRSVPQPAAPTDAQLTAFMTAHAAQLTRPEMRVITLARISAQGMLAATPVDEAAIQKEYDARKATLSTPETRTVIEIPVKTAALGEEAAAALSKGEDPAAIAKRVGSDPLIYADKPQSAIADPKIAVAAFGLKAGQVAGPVQGDLGLAALKVTKITPGTAVSFAAARPKIEADLKLRAAQKRAYDVSQTFDDARQAGSSVADAAKKAGVATEAVGPFTATGAGVDGKPDPRLTDKIVKTAFAQHAGEDSDIQDAGSGEYYALHVDKVIAPALPPLAQEHALLTQAYERQAYLDAVRAKANALVAQLKAGKPIAAVAAGAGAQVRRQANLQLVQAQSYQALGRDFLEGIFASKPGDAFAAATPGGVAIARLDAVRPGDVTSTAHLLEAIRARTSQGAIHDIVDSAKAASARLVKVKINLSLARSSIGVDPASVGGTGAKGAGAAK